MRQFFLGGDDRPMRRALAAKPSIAEQLRQE